MTIIWRCCDEMQVLRKICSKSESSLSFVDENTPGPASHHATRDDKFLRSDSRSGRYVRDLSNVTPRYFVRAEEQVSLLWLIFSSRLASLLLTWKTANTVFVVQNFSFQVWRYSLTVAMFLLSTPSTVCHSPSACKIARSSAYA